MHAREFVARLEQYGYRVEQHGREWRAQCPAHQGEDCNLAISDGAEAILLVCWSHHCEPREIARAVDVKPNELWFEERGPAKPNGAQRQQRVFPYRDEQGRVLYEVRRIEATVSEKKKFEMWLPGAQHGGIGKTRRVLFGLPELLATKPGTVVCIAEGEKCAVATALLGVPCTTNPNGDGQWRPEYTAWLKEHLPDRLFLVLADNDRPGKEHALAVCDQLQAAGLSVWLADLGELPAKGDVVEWIERGGTADQLRAMAADAAPKLWARVLSFEQLLAQPPAQWLIEDFIYEQSMVEFFGIPGDGKTFLIMDLCMSIRGGAGTSWCGRSVDRTGPILYINAEGGRSFADRARAWVLIAGSGAAPHAFWTLPEPVNLYRTDSLSELRALIAYLPEKPLVLAIDTYSRCIPGMSENDQEFASQVVDNLTSLMREFGISPWLVHHTDKTGKHDRGSSVILGACDTQVRVTKSKESVIGLTCEKQRGEAEFEPIYFDLGRVPGTNETWVTWRPEGKPSREGSRSAAGHQSICDYLAKHPGSLRTSLYAALPFSQSTLQRYLRHLIASGAIIEQVSDASPGRDGPRPTELFLGRCDWQLR